VLMTTYSEAKKINMFESTKSKTDQKS